MSDGPALSRALYSAYRRVQCQYTEMTTYGGRPVEWEPLLDRMESLIEKIEARHPHWRALLEDHWLMPEYTLPALVIQNRQASVSPEPPRTRAVRRSPPSG